MIRKNIQITKEQDELLKKESYEKDISQSEIIREALKKYFYYEEFKDDCSNNKGENKIKIIDIVELNENGVDVEEAGNNPMPIKYFDDNGGLPDGNFDENNIAGKWVLLKGRHEIGTYACRTIDNHTLIKLDSFLRNITEKSIVLKSNELKETGDIGKELYNWMWGKLKDWSNNGTNYCTNSDVDSFKKGNWFVEIYIREGGIAYTAGQTKQELNNQPEWAEDSWEDVNKEQFLQEFKKYL